MCELYNTTTLQMFGIHPVLLGPRVDGVFLPEDPALLIKEGRHHHVPLMSGVTTHEGAMTTASQYILSHTMDSDYLSITTRHVQSCLISFEMPRHIVFE